jgi:hypothetical protein
MDGGQAGFLIFVIVFLVVGLAWVSTKRRARPARGAPTATAPAAGPCPRCGATMISLGVERFRTGGTSSGATLLFGEGAELGESILPLEVLACEACRHVELQAPPPA